MSKSNPNTINLVLGEDLIIQLTRLAAKLKRSVSSLARDHLEAALPKIEREAKRRS